MLSLEGITGQSQMLSARKTRHLTTTTKTTTKALKSRNCHDVGQSKDGKAYLKSKPHLLLEVCIRDTYVGSFCSLLARTPAGKVIPSLVSASTSSLFQHILKTN